MIWRVKPALDRQTWLEELGRRLVWYFPAAQVKEILSDYEEQFDEGHDHCKTQAEIIQALGTPAEAAALLLEEEPSARMNGLRQTGLWAAALGLCCAFLWVCLMNSMSLGLLWTGVFLGLPLTASALFLLIRGPARVALEDSPQRHVSPAVVWVAPAVLTLAGAVEKVVLYIASVQVFPRLSETELDRIGRSLRYGNGLFWLALMLVLALLALWLLVRSASVSIRYFPGVIHAFGAMESVLFQWTYFTSIYVEGEVHPMVDLLLRLLPYCTGLLTALVFQRWVDRSRPLPRCFQDGAVTWQDWRHRLGVCLLGWYDAAQAMEVLEDYQEQYDLGREQGKTEAAALSAMGRPEAVVRDLLKEDRKARLRRRKRWPWVVMCVLAGWLLLGLMRAFELGGWGLGWWYQQNSVRTGMTAVVLGAVSLFVLLHVRERAAVEKRFPASRRPTVWPYLLPFLATVLTTVFLVYLISTADVSPGTAVPDRMYMIYIIECSVLLLLPLLLWTLARCSSGSIRYFPAVPQIAGSFAQVLCAGIRLSAMDIEALSWNTSETLRAFFHCLLPYLAGLACSLAVWLILRAAGKKRG